MPFIVIGAISTVIATAATTLLVKSLTGNPSAAGYAGSAVLFALVAINCAIQGRIK
jgi:hypothetical protein